MIIPYANLQKYTEPLIVSINPIVSSDEVCDVVISYASKASGDYIKRELWFDGKSPFMRAKINVEEMLIELNELFHTNLSIDETQKCAGYIMHTIEYIASKYIEEHSFMKKFIVSEREFPETDVSYAIVILAFEMYLNILFLISFEKKEITYSNIIGVITGQSAPSKYNGEINRMIIDLDRIVMNHRKFISE